jgi:UrcA family protein
MTMRKTILITAAALSAVALPALAHAAPGSRPVTYADLDLATHAGRARMNHRIAVAVEAVCGSYAGAPSFETREIDRCRAAARTGIETQLAALRSRTATQVALGSR